MQKILFFLWTLTSSLSPLIAQTCFATQTFSAGGTATTFTVPNAFNVQHTIRITCDGATGGAGLIAGNGNYQLGGKGARIIGTFTVYGGNVLRVVVGANGQNIATLGFAPVAVTGGGGGGGGSAVVLCTGSGVNCTSGTLLIAGGGGGGGSALASNLGINIGGSAVTTAGGGGGQAGLVGQGGGGVNGQGANNGGGQAIISGTSVSTGGIFHCNGGAGFGGGGGGESGVPEGHAYTAGGGGGHSGGASDNVSEGGTSYNIGANQINTGNIATMGSITIECLSVTTLSDNANFTSNATGNWNSPTTWIITSGFDTDGIPDATDNVTISSGRIVTLNTAGVSVTNLILGGGTLQGANALTITGNVNVAGGSTFALGGNVTIGGTFEWRNSAIGNASTATIPTITVAGLATISGSGSGGGGGGGGGGSTAKTLTKTKLILNGGGNWTEGDITMSDNASLETYQTFNFTSATDCSLTGMGVDLLEMKGILNVQGGGNLSVNIPFTNTGTVNITSGALILKRMGTHSAGTYVVNTTDGLQFQNDMHNLAGTSLSGSGSILISGGSTNFTSAPVLPVKMTSGSINGGISTPISSLFTIQGGNVSLVGNVNFTNNLIISGGTFGPTGSVTVGGTLTWSGGIIGTTAAASGTQMTVAGVTTMSGAAKTLRFKKLVLNGGGTYSAGSLTFASNAILEIPVTKTLTVTSTPLLTVTGSGTLLLNGTLNINQQLATDVFSVNSLFENNGSLNINTGSFTYLLSSVNYFGNGSITIASAGKLDINNGVGLYYTNPTLINNGSITTEHIYFNGTVPQKLSGTGTTAYITVDNPNNLSITHTHTISTGLAFYNGKITLENGDLTLNGSTFGADATKYIKLEAYNGVKSTVGTTPVLFPIGKSNYAPVTISQAAGSSLYVVRVQDQINGQRALAGTSYVNKEWQINCSTSTPVSATIKT